jgi:VWFA-related protein
MRQLAILASLGLATATLSAAWPGIVREPTSRTIYVTVTDGKGGPVADLVPSDFTVKEGGKEREVTKAEPASARMRLALAVEERLIGDGATRVALFDFMKRLGNGDEISLITIGLRNTTVVDYTASLEKLAGALNSLTLNPRRESQVAEGVLEIASGFVESKPERPVLVVVAFSGGQAGVEPRTVLEKLRQSGATMHAVTLAGGGQADAPLGALGDQSGREEVLGDGPKQSGGRRTEVTAPAAFSKALQQVANDLSSQYAITYVLPDGVKPEKRISVTLKRRGASLRAPTAIPDR